MSEKWLDELQEKVANCWEWHSPALQIGFRYIKPDQADDSWEIWAYPAVQEIVGGREDGETVWSGFNFDVLEFLSDFEPDAVGISTRQPSHPSELTFEGKFRGQDCQATIIAPSRRQLEIPIAPACPLASDDNYTSRSERR